MCALPGILIPSTGGSLRELKKQNKKKMPPGLVEKQSMHWGVIILGTRAEFKLKLDAMLCVALFEIGLTGV